MLSDAPSLVRWWPYERHLNMTDAQIEGFINHYNYITVKYHREDRRIVAWFPGREEHIIPCKAMDGSEDIVMLGQPNYVAPHNAHRISE